MLVLSRREGQRILFPHLDITVQVLPGKGSTIRLGIQAPSHVRVLREELAAQGIPGPLSPEDDAQKRHHLRNRLNLLAMALHVAEKQLKAGLAADAQATLREAQVVLEELDRCERPPAPEVRSQAIKALLVEDDPNEEALLSSYLRSSGIDVATARDGHEALSFLERHDRPDFLLLDMRLPRLDGPATVAAIRLNPAYRALTIFAVTGSSPADVGVATGQGGVDAWFQKPLNPGRLVEAMNHTASRN
jgi:carbon storage regulator CsrA